MKCIVLDYQKGEVIVYDVKKNQQTEQIEGFLQDKGYKLSCIEFMVVEKLNIKRCDK